MVAVAGGMACQSRSTQKNDTAIRSLHALLCELFTCSLVDFVIRCVIFKDVIKVEALDFEGGACFSSDM